MEGFGGGHGMPDEDEWVAAVESQLAATPSHPFTPDVVAWARETVQADDELRETGIVSGEPSALVKAARQIIAVVEERR